MICSRSRDYFFQSTLLQEERLVSKGGRGSIKSFQSTLLQEERQCSWEQISLSASFNPRSYKRSDDFYGYFSSIKDLSIHAPTRGATKMSGKCVVCGNFQSTLLQEERQQKCTIFLMHLCNNYCIVSI